jgi:hypothetical protein
MGSKVESFLTKAGLEMVHSNVILEDEEFSNQGPASPEVIEAWSARLDRMRKFQEAFKTPEAFSNFKKEFLDCLSSSEHQSQCRVILNIARKK